MLKSIVIILFVLVLTNSQQAISDESSSFCFVKFIGKTPYVIITDPMILNMIHKDILGSWINSNSNYEYYLDTTSVEDVANLYLYYESRFTPRAFEIKRRGFQEGSFTQWDYLIQVAKKDGLGTQKLIHPEKAFYHSCRYQSFIIIKCHPIDVQSVFEKNQKSYLNAAIPAHRLTSYWQEKTSQNSLGSIPPIIVRKSDSLATNFLASLPYYEEDSPTERVHETMVPIRYFRDDVRQTYYCQVISYGSKNYISRLYLFDQAGDIQQSIEGTEFVEIIGVTDVNRDGSHELLMLYSVGGYCGGIELLTLEKCGSSDRLRIVVNTRLDTYFD